MHSQKQTCWVSVLTTKLVMVGVSRAGAVMVVMHPSLSGILAATAVMVRLTLGTVSLLLLLLSVVRVSPPPDATEAVVKDCDDEVTLFAVALLLAAAWERVNMVGCGSSVSRCKNFLRVTWSDSLTNMGRWRHFKR